LSVIRENPNIEPGKSPRSGASKGKAGDAIIVLADSRDPDIRMFDKTKYKLVNFFSKKVTDFQVPDTNSVRASKSGLSGILSKSVMGALKKEDDQLFFVLNDAEAYIVRDSKGKQVIDNNSNQYNLEAEEIRISHKGDNVIYLKNGKAFVAKLKKDVKDGEENITDIWPVALKPEHGAGYLKGLDKLANVFWIANDLIAVGADVGRFTPPQEFMII
jgi:small nuclear ribonucleoprotein (snRNP)-like protein